MRDAPGTFYICLILQKGSNKLWEEAGYDEYHDAADQYGNCLLGTTFPLFEYDAPDIGEHHVECHEDAERQRVHRTTSLEERTP